MTDTKMLEKAINDSGLKRSFIASQIGITAYTLALKIDNKKEFKALVKDADALLGEYKANNEGWL